MSVLDRIRPRRARGEVVERAEADPILSVDEVFGLLSQFAYNGMTYTLAGAGSEEPDPGYEGIARALFGGSSPVFSCEVVRMQVFSEARFQWRNTTTKVKFGNTDLVPLEQPWPNGTTGDLLSRMLLHADLGGNAYAALRPGGGFSLLRPDWVDVIVGSRSGAEDIKVWDYDAEVIGYAYTPGGRHSGRDTVLFSSAEVAHFAWLPDPIAQYRGMSWMTAVVREVMADKSATEHKLRYFDHGATPNLLVRFNVEDLEKFKIWTDKFREDHEGVRNAYKTLFIGAGMDVEAVGNNLEQIDFKATQGAGETRIASAARVPPILAGLSEGLQAATYSNYGMARRAFADMTMRPLWRNVCGSLQPLLTQPGGAELWYDERDISFLSEDEKDASEATQLKASAVKTLVDAGYDPKVVPAAVDGHDLASLGSSHTGLVSVQLQPPGTKAPDQQQNGNGAGEPNQVPPPRRASRALTEGEGHD